jgi:Zn-dependent peptidase ImmA (M78 family)
LAASNSIDELPYQRGARFALEVRAAVGLTYEPILNLWDVVRERGAHLAFHRFGEDGGDGLYLWNGETGLIAANASVRSRLRLRFTVAHELGHHELHRPDTGAYLHADKDIFEGKDPVEQEANAFAGHLLAPDPGVRRTLEDWRITSGSEVSPDVIARLMQHFGVSFETAVFRLHNMGAINAGIRDELLAAKAKHGVGQLCRDIHFNETTSFPLPESCFPTRSRRTCFRRTPYAR